MSTIPENPYAGKTDDWMDGYSSGIAAFENEMRSSRVTYLHDAFKHATDDDWDYIERILLQSVRHSQDAQTRFWVDAMKAARAALTRAQDEGRK